MTKYYVTLNTKENGVEKLGWISAENGWHAMAIAKKVAQRKGLTYTGASSAKVYLGDK